MTLLLLVAVALVFVVAIARHSRLGMTSKDKAGAKPKPLDSRFCGNDEQKQKAKQKSQNSRFAVMTSKSCNEDHP